MSVRWLALCALVLLSAAPLQGATWYADASCPGYLSGNPQACGLDEANACCRISWVISRMNAGDQCVVKAGTYAETLSLADRRDLRFTGQGGPVVTGLDQVGGWVQVSPGVWRADVSAIVSTPASFGEIPQVFVNGRRLDLARYPDNPGDNMLRPYLGRVREGYQAPDGGTSWIASDILRTGNWTGALLWLLPGRKMVAYVQRIDSHDPATGRLYFHATAPYNPDNPWLTTPDANSRFFIFNTLAALSEGEFYYDAASRQVYVAPHGGAYPEVAEVRARRYGARLDRAQGIVFSGINFHAAIFSFGMPGSGASNSSLNHARITYSLPFFAFDNDQGAWSGWQGWPGRSLLLTGRGNRISHCEVAGSWGDGISVFDSSNRVEYTTVHEVAWYASNHAGVYLNGSGHALDHSAVYGTGRCGVLHGDSTRSSITFNDIFFYGYLTTDLGGTYAHATAGSAMGQDNVISRNWVHDPATYQAAPDGRSFYAGIYQDHYAERMQIVRNAVWNVTPRPDGEVQAIQGVGVQTNRPRVATDVADGHSIYANTLWNLATAAFSYYGDGRIVNQRVYNNLTSKPLQVNYQSTDSIDFQNNIPYDLDKAAVLFKDPGAKDFRLKSGAPALDQGRVISGVTDGFAGAAPDIGGYELGGSADTCCWQAGTRPVWPGDGIPWVILLMEP